MLVDLKLQILDFEVVKILDDLNALRFDHIIELFQLFGVKVLLADGVQNVLVGQLPLLFSQLDKLFDE